MTNVTVNGLGVLAVAASNDEIPIWDVSTGQQLKITRANLIGALLTGGGTINTGGVTFTLTGGGTLDLGAGSLAVTGNQTLVGSMTGGGVVATGGWTLTIPTTGTAALVGSSQEFTALQAIAPATNVVAFELRMPSGNTNKAMRTLYNSVERMYIDATASVSMLNMASYDAGAGGGPVLRAGRNSNGSTPSPGEHSSIQANGSSASMWPDNSGVWRTAVDTGITSANFASAGTVVGAQSSHRDFKDITGEAVSDADALAFICQAAEQVARFVYKNGAYGEQEFSGVVLDGAELDRYGMDADTEHPAGKALNLINAVGDLFKAVRLLSARVEALEGA